MTNEEHNKYIAWAFLANGIFQFIVLGFVLLMMGALFAGMPNDPDFPAAFFVAIFAFAGFVNLVFLSPNFIAAYALLKKKPWARIAGIVAAALSAMNVPLGTLAAVYSLWFFCGEQWKEIYPESAGKNQPASLGPGHFAETNRDNYSAEDEAAYIYRTPPPPDWR